jgi:hypothetical protein
MTLFTCLVLTYIKIYLVCGIIIVGAKRIMARGVFSSDLLWSEVNTTWPLGQTQC